MGEKEIYNSIEQRIGRSFRYKGKVMAFVGFKMAPAGRFSIFTDSHTISKLLSEAGEFFGALDEVEPKYRRQRVMLPAVVKKQEKNNQSKTVKDITTMDIKESRNYEQFKPITGNRALNQRKIDKICKDIKAGFNMLPYCPIIVSANGSDKMIIDGQHRAEVSKLTKNPVYYVECEQLDLRQIALLNSRGEKWTVEDFLNCYVKLGIEDYKQLQQLQEEFKSGIILTADLLMNYSMSRKMVEPFQDGKFKINHLEKARVVLKLLQKLFGMGSPFTRDKYMATALQKLIDKGACDFDRLSKKIEQNPDLLVRNHDHKKYLQMLESIYNVRNSNRQTIY